MKQVMKFFPVVIMGIIVFTGCKKTATIPQEEISQSTLAKIYEHGFGTSDVQKVEEGYLVEGDIVLTEEFLGQKPAGNFLRIANNEQYRTTLLVTGLPRTIKIALDSKLSAKTGYKQALQVVAQV